MPLAGGKELVSTAVSTIFQLLSDSESSDTDSDLDTKTTTSDLSTALLVYASSSCKAGQTFEEEDISLIRDQEASKKKTFSSTYCSSSVEPMEMEEESVEPEHPTRTTTDLFDNLFNTIPPATIGTAYLSNLSDIDFKVHFKVNKSTVELLYGLIPDKPEIGRPHINNLTFVLVSLWFMTTKESHNSIAERFRLGKAHTHRIVVDFCNLMSDLSPEYVAWPTRNETLETIDTFKNNYAFPGVIGVLTNSQISIKCPAIDALNYCNSQGKFFVYMQTVVLPSLHFSYAFVGWPGSATDEEVLLKSPLFSALCKDPGTWLHDDCHLVAKGCFPLQTFLMTPYREDCSQSHQLLFNQKHSDVCVVSDYAIGLLKNRFNRLCKMEVHKMDLLTRIIVTACVLHNICLDEEDTYEDFIVEPGEDGFLEFEMPVREAEMKRDAIARSLSI